MRRWLIVLAVVLAIALVGAGALSLSGNRSQPEALQPREPIRAVQMVRAEGRFVPLTYSELAFKVGGRIDKVLVKEGDRVEVGQPLVQLDLAELDLQVKAAEAALAVSEASLAQLEAAPRDENVRVAEANLQSADAKLSLLLGGARQSEIDQAEIALRRAKNNLFLQYTTRDFNASRSIPAMSSEMAEAQIGIAHEDINAAQRKLEALKEPPRAQEVAQAQAAVEVARQQLALAQQPVTGQELAVARARAAQARVALDQAKQVRDNAILTAPFRGTVADVNARLGEIVQPGVPVVSLADLTQMQVETTDLDEESAAEVKVGQEVEITVNSFKGKVLKGKVVDLGRKPVLTAAGDVNYVASIALDRQDQEVRWGMTSKVEFLK